MAPDRSNYEIWLIDYLDGNLDETRVKQLFGFLEANPDLKQKFGDFSGYKLIPACNSTVNKDILKKTYSDLSSEQFDFLCVAASENDLDYEQKSELDAIVNEDPERKKTFELIRKAKLKAPDLKYRKKSGLRKLTTPQKVFRLSVAVVTAAASLALLISVYNSTVKSNKEILPLVTANSSENIVKSASPENIINANPDKGKSLETRSKGIIVQNTVIPVTAVSDEPVVDKPAPIGISQLEQKPVRETISKTDFKPDVPILENSFIAALAVTNTAIIPTPEPVERSGLNTLIARFFREKILKSRENETGSLKPYEIADAGILGLNKLLGWQMSLQKNIDEKGDLKSLYFSSKILKFNAPVRKFQLEP